MAEHIPLPHELILDILSRLPAKSLGRFRCVSKLWSDSIVESNFIQMHLRRAIKQGHTNLVLVTEQGFTDRSCIHLLVGDSFDKPVQIENPFGVSCDFSVLGCCNGIICLRKKNTNVVCLLNPCTREYKVTQFQEEFTDWYHSDAYGFGYDSVNDDYILVIFDSRGSSSNGSGCASQASVYSLNDAFILDSFTIPYLYIMGGEPMGIYLNGFLHWVATQDSSETPVIISFDIEKKRVQEMLTRPGNMCQVDYYYERYISLGVLQGQLSIFDHFRDGIMELWVMPNYGVSDSLVKLLSVDTKLIPISSHATMLCFSENGKLLLGDMQYLRLYDPKQEKMWKISYRGVYKKSVRNWIPHVASLVQLNSGTYADGLAGLKHSKKRKTREHW